ncbi:MAG TPA: restriction endonuclease subunit S, partial [Chitinispirillaceae bacterium]|nr:restriction endonuclease subunit S [Chitinispirillaceae bacterium]
KMTGIIGGISISNFSEISVPLPPLEEQQRIVAKVDQLMSICDKLETQQNKRSELVGFTRKTALETLANAQSSAELQPAWKRVEENLGMLFETPEDIEDLKKCVLQNAVNGLFSINQCTESKVLKDVIVFGPRNGLSPQAVNYFTDKKVLTLSATTKGIIDISKFKHIDMDIESDSHLWLENGDVLIQRGNSKEYVGVSAVYIGPSKSYIYPDLMMKILVDTNMILVDYLHMCLLSPSSRQHMWDRITGTSSTMPKINKNTFETIPIPLPPLAEQHRIVSKAQSLLSLCDKLQSQLAKSRTIAEHLAQSIVESITGITTENQEKMKVPKTELVSKLVLVKKPKAKEHAPLSALLARHNNELSAKALWNHSGMAIDDFYRQLKTEMVNGWIDEPQKAEVRIIEE